MADRVRDEVDRRLRRRAWIDGGGEATLAGALEDLEAGRETPYDVAERIAGGTEPEPPPAG
jgi:hypothetical protein